MPLQFRNPDLVALLSADFVLRRDPARTLRATANLSDPPTDAELSASIGGLADLPDNMIIVNDDAGAGTRTYGILTDKVNNKWWRWKMYEDGEAMPGAGGAITYAVPALTLGTANAGGVATTVIRSDATILAFDATVPTTLTSTTSAAAGSASVAARRDHAHAVTFFDATVPGTIVPDASAAAGSATVAARRDHSHGIATATAVTLSSTSTNTEGAGNNFARATHTHALNIFDLTFPGTVTAGSVGSPGVSNFVSRADHSHSLSMFDATVPGQIYPDAAAAAGSASVSARRDHTHGITADAPATSISVTSTNNTEGTSTSFSRSDHNHAIVVSSSPGTNSRILKTDGSGIIYLAKMKVGTGAITGGIELDINGDVLYNGALYRNSTSYPGYIYVPIFGAPAAWNPASAANKASGTKNSSDFSVPAGAKAMMLSIAITSGTAGQWVRWKASSGGNTYAMPTKQVAGVTHQSQWLVQIDASNQYYLENPSNLNLYVACVGYWL